MSYVIVEAIIIEKGLVLLMIDLHELGCNLCILCWKTSGTISRLSRRLKLDVGGRCHVSDTAPQGSAPEVRCAVRLCQRV